MIRPIILVAIAGVRVDRARVELHRLLARGQRLGHRCARRSVSRTRTTSRRARLDLVHRDGRDRADQLASSIVTDTLDDRGPGARSPTIDGNLNDRLFEVQTNTTDLSLERAHAHARPHERERRRDPEQRRQPDAVVRADHRQPVRRRRRRDLRFVPSRRRREQRQLPDHLEQRDLDQPREQERRHLQQRLRAPDRQLDDPQQHRERQRGRHPRAGRLRTIRNTTISANDAVVAAGGFQSQDSTVTFESVLFADNTRSERRSTTSTASAGGTVGATNSLFDEDITLAPAVHNGANSSNLIAVESQLPGTLSNNGADQFGAAAADAPRVRRRRTPALRGATNVDTVFAGRAGAPPTSARSRRSLRSRSPPVRVPVVRCPRPAAARRFFVCARFLGFAAASTRRALHALDDEIRHLVDVRGHHVAAHDRPDVLRRARVDDVAGPEARTPRRAC